MWGDSHAGAISANLSAILKDNVPYNQLASTACAASWNQDMYDRNSQLGQARNLGCNYQNELMKKLALLLNSERRHACPMCLTLKQYTEFQAYLTL